MGKQSTIRPENIILLFAFYYSIPQFSKNSLLFFQTCSIILAVMINYLLQQSIFLPILTYGDITQTIKIESTG